MLNFTATRKLLIEALEKPQMSETEKISLHEIIDHILSLNEPGGLFFGEEAITTEEKLIIMLSKLAHRGFISVTKNEEGIPVPTDPNLYAILQARAGVPIVEKSRVSGEQMENEQLKALHDSAREITLEAFNLKNDEFIRNINQNLIQLSTEITNLTNKLRLTPIPLNLLASPLKDAHKNLSIIALWQEAAKPLN